MNSGVLNKYKRFLPVTDATPMITLGEGRTPLVRSIHIAKELECKELYFKLEGCNPTGSFKDRGMVMAVAKALEANSRAIICASTGNTSASAAAYGAHFELNPIVLVPKGGIAQGKLAQARVYGAKIILVSGTFDQAFSIVRSLSNNYPITMVNSLNPFRLEGQKTAAFEVVDDLGDSPDMVFIPVGNAGNITAYWRGFLEYYQENLATHLPRMMGFQAAGAAPIVLEHTIANPTTIASAIRIGNPASWKGALAAKEESCGIIDMVTDDEILHAYRLLGSKEGIFCEPASATALAGLLKLSKDGLNISDKCIVCIITGSGLKDPELASRSVDKEVIELQPDIHSIEEALASSLG